MANIEGIVSQAGEAKETLRRGDVAIGAAQNNRRSIVEVSARIADLLAEAVTLAESALDDSLEGIQQSVCEGADEYDRAVHGMLAMGAAATPSDLQRAKNSAAEARNGMNYKIAGERSVRGRLMEIGDAYGALHESLISACEAARAITEAAIGAEGAIDTVLISSARSAALLEGYVTGITEGGGGHPEG